MLRVLIVITLLATTSALAQDKAFRLNAPDALVDTGFLKHLLPRFSLKTGIRVMITPDNAQAELGPQGVPVFSQEGQIWALSKTNGPYTDAFKKWLLSDIGKRTIEAFSPDGVAMFSADVTVKKQVQAIVVTGNVAEGEQVSLRQCGRCHVVNETNKMNAIGSTPSFALMRNFDDWLSRFETFFLLKPHPAFTQVAEVTEPFPDYLPSPIAPIEVTLDQIEAITAYVATIEPADLGDPIQTQ